jgi:hypothetical protein
MPPPTTDFPCIVGAYAHTAKLVMRKDMAPNSCIGAMRLASELERGPR